MVLAPAMLLFPGVHHLPYSKLREACLSQRQPAKEARRVGVGGGGGGSTLGSSGLWASSASRQAIEVGAHQMHAGHPCVAWQQQSAPPHHGSFSSRRISSNRGPSKLWASSTADQKSGVVISLTASSPVVP